MERKQRVVVVGGGFAGLEFIKVLGSSRKYEVILVDVNNYNFFPPLIYQVSTGFMEPSAISYPFRKILRNKESVRFRLGRLERVVPLENKIVLDNGELEYDILVMATGSDTNYFGNGNIERYSLPMKTISDALALRNTILTRLDRATRLADKKDRRRLLTFVIAGAGPTGVELSGILAEMSTSILKKDYPELSQEDLGGIYLIDGQNAVLSAMSEKSQQYTFEKLRQYGVTIKLNTFVNDFDNEKVQLSDGTTIKTKNLIWAAGVSARTFPGFDKASYGRGNRLRTNAYNLVEGYGNVYALGDGALMEGDPNFPNGHPQLAQPAIQQARNLAKNLERDHLKWKAFTYKDKGSLAIIGRNKAVLDLPGQYYAVKGFVAWLIWIFVHIMGLVNFKNRIRAFFNWISYYIFRDQYFRMIIKPKQKEN